MQGVWREPGVLLLLPPRKHGAGSRAALTLKTFCPWRTEEPARRKVGGGCVRGREDTEKSHAGGQDGHAALSLVLCSVLDCGFQRRAA